jgi:hypothetical protein
LIQDVQRQLNADERKFLLSLVNLAPEWELLAIPHAHELPALRWKLLNLEELARKNRTKLTFQAKQLEDLLRAS